jgi:hypothetical protein
MMLSEHVKVLIRVAKDRNTWKESRLEAIRGLSQHIHEKEVVEALLSIVEPEPTNKPAQVMHTAAVRALAGRP